METVKVNTSQHVAIDYPVAGLGERVAAWFIDLGLFIAIFFIFLFIFILTGLSKSSELFVTVMTIIYFAGFVFYDLICEIFMNGQSIGKKILKTKVISLDGAQPTIGQYLIRWVFRIVDFPLTMWTGGLIAVGISENKQRIGDMVAGTTLIQTKRRTNFGHIAFHPVASDYQTVFEGTHQLKDRDIELIHEVITTYHATQNSTLIYQMAEKVAEILGITVPQGMNELVFLKTVIMDYNHATSQA